MSDRDLYAQVITLVAQMSPEGRDRLYQYLKSLKSGQASETSPHQDTDLDSPLTLMKTYLMRRGVDSPPISVIKRSGRFSHCQEKINIAWNWCKKQSDSKVERHSIFLLACRCLDTFLTTQGIPTFYDGDANKPYNRKLKNVGLYDIAMYADFMPSAVEAAFPGYMKIGLLKSVATRMIS